MQKVQAIWKISNFMVKLIKYLLRVSTERTCLVVVGGTYASSMMGRDANVNGRLSDSTGRDRGVYGTNRSVRFYVSTLSFDKLANFE